MSLFKRLGAALAAAVTVNSGQTASVADTSDAGALNYDDMVFLDAEDLAEGGFKEAYDALSPRLLAYVSEVEPIQEELDWDEGRYTIRFRQEPFAIFYPGQPESDNAWANATFYFFKVVNDQLANADVAFYAINGGNDLGGLFLTEAEAEAARRSLPQPRDWPYAPTLDAPWFGQPHS